MGPLAPEKNWLKKKLTAVVSIAEMNGGEVARAALQVVTALEKLRTSKHNPPTIDDSVILFTALQNLKDALSHALRHPVRKEVHGKSMKRGHNRRSHFSLSRDPVTQKK